MIMILLRIHIYIFLNTEQIMYTIYSLLTLLAAATKNLSETADITDSPMNKTEAVTQDSQKTLQDKNLPIEESKFTTSNLLGDDQLSILGTL